MTDTTTDYEALEKKHLGDSEKGTGIYRPANSASFEEDYYNKLAASASNKVLESAWKKNEEDRLKAAGGVLPKTADEVCKEFTAAEKDVIHRDEMERLRQNRPVAMRMGPSIKHPGRAKIKLPKIEPIRNQNPFKPAHVRNMPCPCGKTHMVTVGVGGKPPMTGRVVRVDEFPAGTYEVPNAFKSCCGAPKSRSYPHRPNNVGNYVPGSVKKVLRMLARNPNATLPTSPASTTDAAPEKVAA
jgi:hypothetical protein